MKKFIKFIKEYSMPMLGTYYLISLLDFNQLVSWLFLVNLSILPNICIKGIIDSEIIIYERKL